MGKCEDNLLVSTIERIIRNAPNYHLLIEGNPSEKWFIVRNVHLATYFSSDSCDIMVRFGKDRHMNIYFPYYIGIDSSIEPNICSLFLADAKGDWRCVCPRITDYVFDACFVNVPILLQFVQNPMLCGIQGCDEQVAYEKMKADFVDG
ncbi:hypothetical protein ACFLZ8_02965 [Planctomycetota bacterium]